MKRNTDPVQLHTDEATDITQNSCVCIHMNIMTNEREKDEKTTVLRVRVFFFFFCRSGKLKD